jgi:hypothetical protein
MRSNLDLTNQAADGIEEAVAWHTVGIVADQPRGVGTGIGVLWHGRPLILTAWHVIKDNPLKDLWFFFRAEGTLRREFPEEAARQGKLRLIPRSRIEIQNHHYDQSIDIAALEVRANLDRSRNLRFYEFDESTVTPAIGTTVVMMGYPYDITRPINKETRVVFPSTQWSRRVRRKGALSNFNSRRSFIVDYPSATIDRHPGGFSGCGVWYHRSTPTVWHPSLALAGVCIGYYATSRVVEVLKVAAVQQFLDRALH